VPILFVPKKKPSRNEPTTVPPWLALGVSGSGGGSGNVMLRIIKRTTTKPINAPPKMSQFTSEFSELCRMPKKAKPKIRTVYEKTYIV
jgi:hypothetical protein